MSKIDIDKFIEHLMKWNALDINAVQSALFAQGLTFCGYKIQKIGEIEEKPKWSEEDDCYMSECISAIATKEGWSFEEKRKTKHWLKSIKQRIVQ